MIPRIALLGAISIFAGGAAGFAFAGAEPLQLAQRGFMKGQMARPGDDEEPRTRIRASGIVAAMPREASCLAIASPFGSPTRYDGSQRPMDRFGGVHGGIDITLHEGTPLLAIASGTVVHLGAGGLAEGNYLWLQHAPEQTQLPFWVYAKYQHLAEVPALAVGAKVRAGEVVARSGSSGTVGPHYGPRGYAHLHLSTFASWSGNFERQGSRVVADAPRLFDPVAIYVRGLNDLDGIERMSPEQKNIPIPYVAESGAIVPADSAVVWPVGCKQG